MGNEPMRQTRADEVRRERRHKRGATVHTGYNLTVDESKLDRENYVHRFVNDTPGRIEAFTKGGEWDVVEDPKKELKSDATGEGTGVSVVAGTREGGQPMRTVLLRKPKWIHDEDKKAKAKDLDEMMKGLARGVPQAAEGTVEQSATYVPEGGISIGADR